MIGTTMSDNRTTELLLCPFCKGEAETFNPFDNADGTWCVLCSECAAATGFEQTEAEAIAVWNTRAPVEYEGWFYLPKPKNSLVHYGTPQIEKTENGYKAKQPVEVIESAIRAWGDELDEHIMKRICEVWNTRTHGTLTAEQVEDIVYRNTKFYEGGDVDVQAITDELNAELGSGTCEPDEDGCCPYCGEDLVRCDVGIGAGGGAVELDPPIYYNYCPNCGAKVVKR